MKRFLIAAVIAGLAYAVLGFVFVHYLLPAEREQELTRVLAKVAGSTATDGTDWAQVAMQVGMRLVFGLLTMALFAFLKRKRPKPTAARLAGFVFWFVTVAIAVRLHSAHGLSLETAGLCVAWELLETQVAANVGALALVGKAAP